jgi:hypothetical protein
LQGEFDHQRIDPGRSSQILPPDHSLISRDRAGRALGKVGGQFVPRVPGGGHLGERTEREPPGSFENHGSCQFAGCLECQPVFDVVGDSPELLAALDRMPAASLEIDQPLPIPTLAQPIDQLEQLGRLPLFDRLGQRVRISDCKNSLTSMRA